MKLRTYNQALTIVRNPDAYKDDAVRSAAVYILGTLHAKPMHIEEASDAFWLVTDRKLESVS